MIRRLTSDVIVPVLFYTLCFVVLTWPLIQFCQLHEMGFGYLVVPADVAIPGEPVLFADAQWRIVGLVPRHAAVPIRDQSDHSLRQETKP